MAPARPDPPAPAEALLHLLAGKGVAQAISVAARLGIADRLAAGPATVDELARANQVDSKTLGRLLRALASLGLFAETADGLWAMTPGAEPLRSDDPESVRALAMAQGLPWSWGAWADLLGCVKTGEPASERVFGVDPGRYFAAHPAEAATFAAAARLLSVTTGAAVAAQYDFAAIQTLVEIGCGPAPSLGPILATHPTLRGIAFDEPAASAGAAEALESAGVAARVRVHTGDHLDDLPSGADAYLLPHLLRDLDDAQTLALLDACRRAARPKGRLLVVEMLIRTTAGPAFAPWVDLDLLVLSGGRLRTDAEFESLIRAGGLRIERAWSMTYGMQLFELVPANP